MEAAGMALAVVGYALFYTGASNLFTGGKGWGFLQSLLNKGEANQSGSFANQAPSSSKGSKSKPWYGKSLLDLGNSVFGSESLAKKLGLI